MSDSVLFDSVDFASVSALLSARELTPEYDGALIDILQGGIVSEIARIVTHDPEDSIKEVAKRAVIVGTARDWERSKFPNSLQQEGSLADQLNQAYLGLREELKAWRADKLSAVTSGPYIVGFW